MQETKVVAHQFLEKETELECVVHLMPQDEWVHISDLLRRYSVDVCVELCGDIPREPYRIIGRLDSGMWQVQDVGFPPEMARAVFKCDLGPLVDMYIKLEEQQRTIDTLMVWAIAIHNKRLNDAKITCGRYIEDIKTHWDESLVNSLSRAQLRHYCVTAKDHIATIKTNMEGIFHEKELNLFTYSGGGLDSLDVFNTTAVAIVNTFVKVAEAKIGNQELNYDAVLFDENPEQPFSTPLGSKLHNDAMMQHREAERIHHDKEAKKRERETKLQAHLETLRQQHKETEKRMLAIRAQIKEGEDELRKRPKLE